MGYLFYLSLLIFFISIYFFTKTYKNKKIKFVFSILYFINVSLFLIYVGSYYFTAEGITRSVIYHLKYGIAGAGILEYIDIIIILIIAIFISILIFYYFILKRNSQIYQKKYLTFGIFIILISLVLNPATSDIYNLYSNNLFGESKKFNQYYKEPNITKIDNNKNLVFIYAESLERTYFNQELFPGLMKNLKEIQKKSTYFTNIRQVSGAGFTMGGKVASQAGIPLYTPSHGNSMSGVDSFLPGTKTLGDLLKDKGYYLTFMGGADLEFAGKGKFYKTHSFDEVKGRNELQEIINKRNLKTNNWGLYDKDLLNLAYEKYTTLANNKDNFALFLLTIGTHHPKGHYKTDIKYKKGNNEMLNAVASSDYLISKFINKILNSQYKEDTIIVLVSDHLAMRNNASHLLNKGDRTNTFMIVDPTELEGNKINRKGSALDIAPTISNFLGYNLELGLGRNLLTNEYDKNDINTIHSSLSNWRDSILDFWEFPKIKKYVHIKPSSKDIIIDDRKYEIPILIEIDDNFKTMIRFDSGVEGQKFEDYIKKIIEKNKRFIYIDKTKNASKVDNSLKKNKYSLILGKGNKIIDSQPINGDIRLNKDKLKMLFNSKYYSNKINLWQITKKNYTLKETINAIKEGKLVIISAKDEARKNLPSEYISELSNYGSNIKKLDSRESYIAIFYNQKLIKEKIGKDKENNLIKVTSQINDHTINIKSAGFESENISSIKIDGKEFSKNRRGLNIIVVNNLNTNTLSTFNFDTHSENFKDGF